MPICIFCGEEVDTTKPGYHIFSHFSNQPTPYAHHQCVEARKEDESIPSLEQIPPDFTIQDSVDKGD